MCHKQRIVKKNVETREKKKKITHKLIGKIRINRLIDDDTRTRVNAIFIEKSKQNCCFVFETNPNKGIPTQSTKRNTQKANNAANTMFDLIVISASNTRNDSNRKPDRTHGE